MPLIKYPREKDYGTILSYNTNWWRGFRFTLLVLSQIEDVEHHMAEIISQLIYNNIELEIDPKDRQDTEQFLAVRLLFLEFGDNALNALNWVIKCILAKACHLFLQTSEAFPLPSSATLVSIDEKKYEVRKGFINYLHELGQRNPVAIGRLLIFATNRRKPVKTDLEDVEICISEELSEMFEKGKDNISIESLNQLREE